jgi:hypothetical protein
VVGSKIADMAGATVVSDREELERESDVPGLAFYRHSTHSEEIGRVPQVSILRPGILLGKSGSGPIM